MADFNSYIDSLNSNIANGGGFDAGKELANLQSMLNEQYNPQTNQSVSQSGPSFGGNPSDPWGGMTPSGVPSFATPSMISTPGGGMNQQWNWSTPQANYGVGVANPWQMSAQDRAMAMGPGGIFGSRPMPAGSLPPGNYETGPGASHIVMPGTYPVTGPRTGFMPDGSILDLFGSYPVARPQDTGMQTGGFNPFNGGNALEFLQRLGGGVPSSLASLFSGQPVGQPGNMGAALNGLGGWSGGLPSPQSFGNMSPSELDFLAGFFESLLGIPFNDIVAASLQPFSGLNTARPARKRKTR